MALQPYYKFIRLGGVRLMAEKTILKLYENGDFEVRDVELIKLDNLFVRHTCVDGFISENGILNPPTNSDKTSDFIKVEKDYYTIQALWEHGNRNNKVSYLSISAYDVNFQLMLTEEFFVSTTETEYSVTLPLQNYDFSYLRVSVSNLEVAYVLVRRSDTIVTSYRDSLSDALNNGFGGISFDENSITVGEIIKYNPSNQNMPSWVRDTGQPISIFPEGIVIKGNLIQGTTTTEIVKNGLLAYWNSKSGIGTTWENIAPNTQGQYDAFLFQMSLTEDGVHFNGSTSYIQLPIPTELKTVTSATFEMRFKSYGGWADVINQDGRELLWIGPEILALSGIFDNDKWRDHIGINTAISNVEIYLTITADLTNSRITAYLHNPVTNTTVTDFYTTTIGTFANGDFVWLSSSETPFSGYMDNIRIYNRALTQEEILQNWSVGRDLGI